MPPQITHQHLLLTERRLEILGTHYPEVLAAVNEGTLWIVGDFLNLDILACKLFRTDHLSPLAQHLMTGPALCLGGTSYEEPHLARGGFEEHGRLMFMPAPGYVLHPVVDYSFYQPPVPTSLVAVTHKVISVPEARFLFSSKPSEPWLGYAWKLNPGSQVVLMRRRDGGRSTQQGPGGVVA